MLGSGGQLEEVMRRLAVELAVTAFVLEGRRDQKAQATRLNGMARRYMLDLDYKREVDGHGY